MAQAVDEVYNQLNPVYDQLRVVNDQQQASAQQDYAVADASLEQAKVNAFKDIDLSANRKGVLFSGFSPDQQAQYTGTKFLPAKANLSAALNKALISLRAENANIGVKQRGQAQDIVNEQIKEEARQAEQARQDAYRQAQLGLSYARLGISQSNAANSQNKQALEAAQKAANQFQVTQKKDGGGFNFTGPQGRPVSLAQYVSGVGGDANTVLDLLKNGSTYDKRIYNNVNIMLKNKKIGGDAGAILTAIANQDSGNYYGLK